MNITEQEIENRLRRAPAPQAPAGLKELLAGQIQLVTVTPKVQAPARAQRPGSWLGRWWPALAPLGVSLACAVVVSLEQMEIRDLRQAVQSLSQGAGPAAAAPEAGAERAPGAVGPAESEAQELARLEELARRLRGEVAQLESLRAENEQLRARIAAVSAGHLTPQEEAAVADAREEIEEEQCLNNLKQLGISVKTWALDNDRKLPPDVLCMSNELSAPLNLICPSDKGHQAAESWSTFTPANCSYEYLGGSGGKSGEEPARVLFRCPIHGNVGLDDGSVRKGVAKEHPERLVSKDGKLYLREPQAQPGEETPGAPGRESNPNPKR